MTKTNLSVLIDEFGQLKADMANLAKREAKLKKELGELDVGSYEGELVRLSITAPEREKPSEVLRERIKDVVEAFRSTLSHQYLAAHAPLVKIRTLTVRARNGDVDE